MAKRSFSDDQWAHIYELSQVLVDVPRPDRQRYLESQSTDPELTDAVLSLAAELESSTEETSRVGSHVGRFEIRDFLGAGAAGEVFLAYDPELRREVAIKILRAEQLSLPDADDRFIREARTASTLNHPNIVTVHEFIRGESNLAIVMELVKGEPLRRICATPLSIPRLMNIGRQIADALAAAHAAGVVHRDIKPENVMLTAGDRVKVLDFGLARLDITTNQTLNTGIPAGTVRYMSPEHYRGEKLTSHSDIFALGIVLYELATGQHPFPSRSGMDVLHAIATEAIPAPSTLNSSIPPQLDELILGMLAKDPPARPAAAEVALKLSGTGAPPAAPLSSKNRAALGVVVTALLAFVGYVTWRLPSPTPDPELMEQVTYAIEENRLTAAAISPDGKFLAYATVDGVFLQTLASGAVSSLHGPADHTVDHLSWFPDSIRMVASGFTEATSQSGIWLVSALGEPARLLRNDSRWGIASPDGEHLAFLGNDYASIWTMDKEGQSAKRIVDAPLDVSFGGLYWFSNSRHLIAFRRENRENAPVSESADSIVASDGTLADRLPHVNLWSAVALPNGKLIFASSSTFKKNGPAALYSTQMDLASGKFISKPLQIFTSPGFGDQRSEALTASADGAKLSILRLKISQPIFVANFHRDKLRLSDLRRLTLDGSGSYPHAWTADSKAVIYESDLSKHSYDLYKHTLDSRLPDTILSTPNRNEVMPQMTPDQKSVLFAASKEVSSRPLTEASGAQYTVLMRANLDGGGAEEVPIGGPLDEFRCSPHTNGRCVLRKTIGTSKYLFFALDPQKGIGEELARVPWWPSLLGDWDLSPDGRFVAMPNHDPRVGKVRIIRVDKAGREELDREITLPQLTNLAVVSWVVDGKGWFVSVETSIGRRMHFYDLNGTVTPLGAIHGWAVPSPDGKKVAFLNNVVLANVWILDHRP